MTSELPGARSAPGSSDVIYFCMFLHFGMLRFFDVVLILYFGGFAVVSCCLGQRPS
jgi:hypothetical protein